MPDEPSDTPREPDPFDAANADRAKGSHRQERPESSWKKWISWVGALVVLGVGTSVAFAQLTRPTPVGTRTSVTTSASTVPSTTPTIETPFAVTIEAISDISSTPAFSSGTVVRDGEYILTTAHTVKDAVTVVVIDEDDNRHEAVVLAIDLVTNLAALKVETPLVPMGEPSADEVTIGAQVITPPAADPATVIGVRQRLDVSDAWRLYDLIELDRNPPAELSGGPLLDSQGKVVGIVTVMSDDGPGYAIPIATGLTIADELIEAGAVAHGYLGVQGLDSLLGGIEIFAFPPNSGLRAAGAREGDRIVSINGTELATTSDLVAAIRTYREGDNVTVSIVREFETIAFDVILNRHPDS